MELLAGQPDYEVVASEEQTSLDKQDKAARIIQHAWKRLLDISIFHHFKDMIDIRKQGEPHQIMKYINPKEAEVLDAAAGIIVRFRLGGVKFPPSIYYKIFTHRHIEDLCANSPRDYTNLPPKHVSHFKSENPPKDDGSGWYRRIENNGWRPVSDRFWMPSENEILDNKKELKFHFSKLMRKKDLEKRRKSRKIEWMKQMYYAGSLEAKSTNYETLGLIHAAAKGLIRTFEKDGVDSVMEWEVDEVLNWTNTLNFDKMVALWRFKSTSNSAAERWAVESFLNGYSGRDGREKKVKTVYIASWKEIATSNSSDNLKGFSFQPAREKPYSCEVLLEDKLDTSDKYSKPRTYTESYYTEMTPESVYEW
ncbi:PREDICTED: uncharacterized protein C11orf65 homolog [Elephantulus edwardii]|uniref:uncharacterized protein C11orf65 homolog n=1 Tax=Elephantulus edwardii TaxID=28737 RepID=UPI0003F0DA11|nr:PREDICTED: uncharacterized protein C11orf65 homolog [Elephantulus edwardii]